MCPTSVYPLSTGSFLFFQDKYRFPSPLSPFPSLSSLSPVPLHPTPFYHTPPLFPSFKIVPARSFAAVFLSEPERGHFNFSFLLNKGSPYENRHWVWFVPNPESGREPPLCIHPLKGWGLSYDTDKWSWLFMFLFVLMNEGNICGGAEERRQQML